jgi:hypothetical protein
MKVRFGIPVLLAALAGISPLKAASPAPAPSPAQTQPATASSKDPAAPEDVESQSRKGLFLAPVWDFARDSILRPKTPFELVPGKDPNGWSFMLEPYGWAMGLDGDVDVKGLPAVNIDIDAKKILQHLDWGIFARGEIRKGRWGLLGDGFYAKLSGVGDLGGVLYSSGSLTVKQGLAQLALAYRIIDDRRGFLDFYAGARYNYLGVSVSLNIDEAGIQDLSENVTERVVSRARAGAQSAVSGEQQKLQVPNQETAILEEDVRDRIARGLESDLEARLRQDLSGSNSLRDALRKVEFARLSRGVRGELRALVDAVIDADEAEAQARLAAPLEQDRARVARAKAAAQARVAQAEKRLSKAIAQSIQDSLPTSGSGDVWWVDPIIGLRAQVNFTRWLFLAAQGDVGGFGAGSQIAWVVQATVGVNFTRNIFAELGYRYMYVDYENSNLLYQMNSLGLFAGLGFKF